MNKRRLCRLIAISTLLLSNAAILTACGDNAPSFASIDITGADYARDFSLPDQNGKIRSIKDFPGKIVVVFFGYAQCPDVCPTTMAELAEVRRILGKDGERLQGVFISVDPDRDTRDILKAYVESFDPTFVALRADSPEQLAAVAKDYKVYYKKVAGSTPTSYSVDHSAGSYVYDTQGRVRLYTRYGSGAKPLAGDIALLLQQAP